MIDSAQQNLDEPQEPAPIEPQPLPTPSPTFYSQLALALFASIDQFTAAVPDFDSPLQLPPDFVRAKRRLPKRFVEDAVSALLVNGELQGLKIWNAAEVIDDKQYVDAFIPLVRHLEAALKGLKFTIEVREARLGASAQKIYTMAKALAQDRTKSTIGVHADNMKKSRRRTKKALPEAARKEAPVT